MACDAKFSIIGGLVATSIFSLSQMLATGNGVVTAFVFNDSDLNDLTFPLESSIPSQLPDLSLYILSELLSDPLPLNKLIQHDGRGKHLLMPCKLLH